MDLLHLLLTVLALYGGAFALFLWITRRQRKAKRSSDD